MPFFTPNRRPLLNMLEHVEPAGETGSPVRVPLVLDPWQ
jgi:hypothetical protein